MFHKNRKIGKLQVGLELKRCVECPSLLRPCLVDGKPAVFHRWVEDDKAMLRINYFARPEEQERLVRKFKVEDYIPNRCSTEIQRVTSALVEYADGSVGMVRPNLVQFIDRGEV